MCAYCFNPFFHVLQADPDAKLMRNKSWPLWETWTIIFGQDRANGGNAEDIADGAREVHLHNMANNDDPSNDYHVSLEDLFDEPINPTVPTTNAQQDESTGQSQQPDATPKQPPPKKRKAASSDAALMEFLANLHAETNKRLEVISSRIGYDFDMGQARQDVYEKLRSVEGLTVVQRYQLCNILADKPQRLEVFMGMAADAKPGYVLWLLGQDQ